VKLLLSVGGRLLESHTWSAPTVMTTSTPGSPPHTSRHKSLESPLRGQPARRVRREAAPEKDLHHRHLAVRPTHPVKVAGRWVYLYRAID
jgi:hypothetical protein